MSQQTFFCTFVQSCNKSPQPIINDDAVRKGVCVCVEVQCYTHHVLHSWVKLVHKLKEFVDNRPQELPMRTQEARILTDDVHDVTCNLCGKKSEQVIISTKHEKKQRVLTTALLSLPFFISHRPRRSLMTVTKNFFSSSSDIAPEMEPTAQHSVLRLCHDHSVPFTWRWSLSSMMRCVSSQLRFVRYTSVSLFW